MFLRPRRFGKSLWIAILEAYYDVHYKDEFNDIFNDTWILNNRTTEAGSYHILRLDFSAVEVHNAEVSFREYLYRHINAFTDKYALNVIFKSENPISMLDELFVYIQANGLKLYVLIDEYDNFANKLFLQDKKLYQDIVSDKAAFFKQFFTTLKTGTGGNVITTDALVQDFSAFNLTKEENFKSLLFYQGLITIKAATIDLDLQIPNETIKRIDIDFLKDSLEFEDVFTLKTAELANQLKQFALTGSLEVFEYLAGEIKRNTTIRDYIYSEECIKSMYLAYLSLTPYFVIKSEAELIIGGR